MEPSKIIRMNLSDRIFEDLKERITRWEFRPGDRLLDTEIAEQYGVSRSLVRNAITLLVGEGLVEVQRRRFYVARYSQKDVRDVLELRRLLELSAVKAAVQGTTDDELAEMEAKMAVAEKQVAEGKLDGFYALDVKTHRLIIDKGDNDYIKKVYDNLQAILSIVIRSDFDKYAKIEESFAEHKHVLEAWKTRDVAATRAALASHLDGAETRVMENFAPKQSGLDTESPEPWPMSNLSREK